MVMMKDGKFHPMNDEVSSINNTLLMNQFLKNVLGNVKQPKWIDRNYFLDVSNAPEVNVDGKKTDYDPFYCADSVNPIGDEASYVSMFFRPSEMTLLPEFGLIIDQYKKPGVIEANGDLVDKKSILYVDKDVEFDTVLKVVQHNISDAPFGIIAAAYFSAGEYKIGEVHSQAAFGNTATFDGYVPKAGHFVDFI